MRFNLTARSTRVHRFCASCWNFAERSGYSRILALPNVNFNFKNLISRRTRSQFSPSAETPIWAKFRRDVSPRGEESRLQNRGEIDGEACERIPSDRRSIESKDSANVKAVTMTIGHNPKCKNETHPTVIPGTVVITIYDEAPFGGRSWSVVSTRRIQAWENSKPYKR